MNTWLSRILISLSILPALVSCTPHPGAGNWIAVGENDWGIPGLTLAFEGRAQFHSRAPAASWHCFWNAQDARNAQLTCRPSTDTEQELAFLFQVGADDQAILYREGQVIARFRRIEGKPDIP